MFFFFVYALYRYCWNTVCAINLNELQTVYPSPPDPSFRNLGGSKLGIKQIHITVLPKVLFYNHKESEFLFQLTLTFIRKILLQLTLTFIISEQRGGRYSVPGMPQTTSTLSPAEIQRLPGAYLPQRHQQHNPAYLQEASALPPYLHEVSSRTSSLPRRTSTTTITTVPTSTSIPTSTTTRSYYHSSHLHLFSCPDVAVGVPPPAEYLDPERKRVSFARSLSYDEDGPSTPLLKKGESSVWCSLANTYDWCTHRV